MNVQYLALFTFLFFMACGQKTSNEEKQTPSAAPTVAKAVVQEVESDPFILHYTGPKNKIMVNESSLTHYRKEEHHAPGSVSATPKSVTTNTLLDKAPLNKAQIDLLKEALSNGFMELKPDYGAPTNERHYPFYINVSFNGQNKEVLFRSNPSYGPAPDAFKEVEAAIFQASETLR